MTQLPITDIPEIQRVPSFVGGKQIEFIEKEVPVPGPGQLLLQVKANALCGSERPQYFDGTTTIPGHEAAGVVVAAGSDTQTEVGSSGVVFLMDYCGVCRNCTRGFTNQCLQKRGDMGFNRDGGYGQYELINENTFFAVDNDISPTEATLLLDIMGTNGHGVRRAHLVHQDIESVLVLGAGPIGLGMLAMVKIMMGQDMPVLITDMVPYRLKLAEQLGGLPIHVGNGSLADGLKAHGFREVDVAFDTTGKEVARRGALDMLAQRGALLCIGHGEGLSVKVSPDLIATERAILGSEYFAYSELNDNLPLLRQHRDYLNQIITHRYGVDEIKPAFDLFFGGETGKVIIEQ